MGELPDNFHNDFGVKAGVNYYPHDKLGFQANINYFLPKKDGVSELSLVIFDVNGLYDFYSTQKTTIYALAGVNSANATLEVDEVQFQEQTFGGSNRSESEIGINLGVGLQYRLNFVHIFTELKMGGLTGDASQFETSAGLRINPPQL